MVIAAAILILEALGVPMGLGYGAILTALNLLLAGVLFYIVDRGATIRGAGYRGHLIRRQRVDERRRARRDRASAA